ncbi:MAG: nucleotidyltransferase family protein [Eubacterium sp.]|nr:nucleotidyltransferase family protein [Eubacterium sp.]
MMNKEKDYLIKLCASFLNGKNQILDESIDYSMLFELSNAHNLSAVVFCVLKNADNKDIIDKEVFKKFEDDFYNAVFRYSLQSSVAGELSAAFEENEIKYVFFKGIQIRDFYPVPQARVMGDIDVLIPAESRERAKEILQSRGFASVNSNGPVWDYRKNGVTIEVHTKIISGKVGSANAEEGFANALENADFKSFRGELGDDFHFAYLLTHIAHHFWFYGAGIKMILDLAAYMKFREIDIQAVLSKMREIGLEDFAKVILSICFKWFSVGEDFGRETKTAEEFLASFGAFGNRNRNKAAVVERKELEEGKETSKFKTRLRLAFPSYEKMKNIPYIGFIEGKPYLTPAAWAYRFYYNYKNRKDFVKQTTKSIGNEKTKELAEKELEFFEEIGLL